MSIAQSVRRLNLGASYEGRGICSFTVWGPLLKSLAVKIVWPEERLIPLERDGSGYWKTTVQDLFPGTRYFYRINDEKDRPDPASRFQPEGVHGPSEIVDADEFQWQDRAWTGFPLDEFIIYELHIGAFTRAGTFEAAVSRLDYLKELGVTVLEIMPVAQFPGARNWGYDGVYPFAPQNSYGGPQGLKALVNACHNQGFGVVLDVVYNHLGPDGNYLSDFGPYFTPKYKTPWGDAVNMDGAYSDEVRRYFVENALYWVTEYHMDGLRLDAIDTIYDFGARHFLAQLTEAVHARAEELGRTIVVTAESDLNNAKLITSVETGGYGVDAQWNDDFHHALHTLLTTERKGYYLDFGGIEHLARAFREGYVYSGSYSAYRKRTHGNSSKNRHARQFIVCSQNHDQIGNRMLGERLSALVTFEQAKLAAACVLLSPFIPLLFMGEDYGEIAPFQYFVHHIDEHLISAIRKGRTEEFAHFEWNGEVPDAQDEKTFLRSKIDPGLRRTGRHKVLFEYYKLLIYLRKSLPALERLSKDAMDVTVFARERSLSIRRLEGASEALIILSFHEKPATLSVPFPRGAWEKVLDSSSPAWGGMVERANQEFTSRGSEELIEMNAFSLVLYALVREEA